MVAGTTPEPLSASGRSSEKMSLPTLQSKMKADPEGYTAELSLVYSQFNSALDLFRQQASMSSSPADPAIAKDLGDRAMFLAHVAPFFPDQLTDFPGQLAGFLGSSARTLPSGLRVHATQALILLINRNMVDIGETLGLFMELQTLEDRNLRKLAFSHVIQSIKRMNKKHKNEAKNRALQNILFKMLNQENEADARRSLVTLCELHRRRIWFNDRTADAICKACFHPSSRIMIAAISFLLDYEKLDDGNGSDSDASSDEDEENAKLSQVVLNKETIYKARNKGTVASKKKKKAKLLRIVKSMKKKQRMSSEQNISNYYSPLSHLKDAQGFVERLFSRLQTCNERFEVKMLILKVISRTVGLHKLILLNFYPYLQKYIQPHQRDITNLLAAAIQACHDMVPPDAVEPLFKQIVNQFVHDRSRPEAIAVGLNSVREICLRMPLLMTEDLLQDLVLYKKSHEKAVSSAARSLVTLFREICPSLLVKKDRGRPTEPKAKPKAYGEVNVESNVPGLELLEQDDDSDDYDDGDGDQTRSAGDDEMIDDEENQVGSEDIGSEDSDEEYDSINEEEEEEEEEEDDDDDDDDDDDNDHDSNRRNVSDEEEQEAEEDDEANESLETSKNIATKPKSGKRKFSDFSSQLISAESSLRVLKKLAEENSKSTALESTDGFLSNEDFQRIKELKDKKDVDKALTRRGFKSANPDKRVDPASLEAHVRKRITKEEKLALVRAGREGRGKFRSGTAVSHKKTGGKSNQEKNRKKLMPIAAKRRKIERNRQEKSRKSRNSGKQFRGKKAWKQ